ncbi:helix-turn-helix domain-containing protein [Natroniella sulfidigena]|uniref:helix-turn-helix domain-containing protein n=1 Tax=Natroniella sulfidigena TaxID=723921 RepID=UPI00200B7643|nr:helix-turn-helix domain-containing protein [Natroniella sulfidigena]MCK8816436.1 helix-turn-helix domain-containing protein [Natroniella sulfidigena]
MSKNKKRAPQEKMQIVLEALQNDNISETCRKYGIYENQFYQWRKKLLNSADNIFQHKSKRDPEKEKLKQEKDRLEKTIVELSTELQILKKNDV